ncbi:hypothetical protein ACJX0J_018914, partial [Zea mays]
KVAEAESQQKISSNADGEIHILHKSSPLNKFSGNLDAEVFFMHEKKVHNNMMMGFMPLMSAL